MADLIENLHSLKIVHRDIKPSNVIYNKQTGKLTLIDFGISKQQNSLDEKMNGQYGTTSYMAPEITNKKEYDYSVDWFAYGRTLLLLFGGIIELKKTVINNEQNYEIVNNFNDLNDSKKDLILHCTDAEENRIHTLDQIKGHEYFKDLQWETVHNQPTTVNHQPLIDNFPKSANEDK